VRNLVDGTARSSVGLPLRASSLRGRQVFLTGFPRPRARAQAHDSFQAAQGDCRFRAGERHPRLAGSPPPDSVSDHRVPW